MTTQQIRELINDVLEQETMMVEVYQKIVKDGDSEVLSALTPVIRDEKKHIENAKKMLEIIQQ